MSSCKNKSITSKWESKGKPDLSFMKESAVLRLIHRLKHKEQQMLNQHMELSAQETKLLNAAHAELDRRDKAIPIVLGSSNWDMVVTGRKNKGSNVKPQSVSASTSFSAFPKNVVNTIAERLSPASRQKFALTSRANYDEYGKQFPRFLKAFVSFVNTAPSQHNTNSIGSYTTVMDIIADIQVEMPLQKIREFERLIGGNNKSNIQKRMVNSEHAQHTLILVVFAGAWDMWGLSMVHAYGYAYGYAHTTNTNMKRTNTIARIPLMKREDFLKALKRETNNSQSRQLLDMMGQFSYFTSKYGSSVSIVFSEPTDEYEIGPLGPAFEKVAATLR